MSADPIRNEDGSAIEVSSTIRVERKKNNSHSKPLVNIDLGDLTRDYASGLSLRALALKYATSKQTIKRKLENVGVAIKKDQSTKSPKTGIIMTNVQYMGILDL